MKQISGRLKLQLLSDTLFASGHLHSHFDAEFQSDSWGLPFIGARRLKGLWREACEDLLAVSSEPTGILRDESVELLFGKPGMKEAGLLQLSNAEWIDADHVRAWLEYWESQKNNLIDPKNIKAYFGASRTRTAINQDTYTALPHSLRFQHLLKAGLEFEAKFTMTFKDPFPSKYIEDRLKLLADACRYIRVGGMGRNRGYGQLKVELIECYSMLTIENQSTEDQSELKQVTENERSCIHYQIKLLEPCLIRAEGSDPNAIQSKTLILGRSIWGALGKYCYQMGICPDNQILHEIFTNPYMVGIRFTPASLYRQVDWEGRCFWPSPLFFREKMENELDNLLLDGPTEKNWPLLHSLSSFSRDNEELHTTSINSERIPHSQHNPGRDQEIFYYEPLSAKQVFIGQIWCNQAQCAELKAVLKIEPEIRLGLSSQVGYGKAKISIPDHFENDSEENDILNFEEQSTATTQEWILWLQSDTLIRNNKGFTSTHPQDLCHQIQIQLDLNDGDIVLLKMVSRPMHVYGFSGLHQSFLPLQNAFQAGSGFRFGFKSNIPNLSHRLRKLEQFGIGEFTQMGWGQHLWTTHTTHYLSKTEDMLKLDSPNVSDNEWHKLANFLILEYLKRIIQANINKNLSKIEKIPNPIIFSKIQDLFHSSYCQSSKEFQDILKGLKQAQTELKTNEISNWDSNISIWDKLTQDPNNLLKQELNNISNSANFSKPHLKIFVENSGIMSCDCADWLDFIKIKHAEKFWRIYMGFLLKALRQHAKQLQTKQQHAWQAEQQNKNEEQS